MTIKSKAAREAGRNTSRPNSRAMDEHRSIKFDTDLLNDIATEAGRLGVSSSEFTREASRAVIAMINHPGEALTGVPVPSFILRARLLRQEMPNVLTAMPAKRKGKT